jgi:Undecaprenyl-phosphate galactose phosphotransferase WbaP
MQSDISNGSSLHNNKRFIEHHMSYFLPAIYMITDWLFILLAEHISIELRNCLTGNTSLHIAWANQYLAFPLIFIAFLRHSGVYQKPMGIWIKMERIFWSSVYAMVLIVFLVYATHIADSTSRLFIVFLGFFAFLFLCLSRVVIAKILDWAGVGNYPVLLVGAGKTAQLLLRGVKEDIGLNFHFVGYVDDAGERKEYVGDLPYLGTFDNIEQVIADTQVNDVIIATPGLTPDKLDSLIYRIQPLVRNLAFVPDLIGLPVNGVTVESMFNERLLLMGLRNNLARRYNKIAKYIFDMVLTTVGVICISPILLLLAILIRLDSPGPIIFAHKRIGQNGKEFPCYKFRTMCVDADVKLKEYLAANPEAREEWERDFKLKDDPRVTRVGRVLRRTSLDELPQLFNVLKGEMSLVGPRPIVTAEIPRYGNYIADFYMVRPGITGMWQVNGRSDTTYEERVQMDSWYVRNWSVWLDLSLLWKTFSVVLHHKGAY